MVSAHPYKQHCKGIADVMGLNPVEEEIFSSLFFASCVHIKCDGLSLICSNLVGPGNTINSNKTYSPVVNLVTDLSLQLMRIIF